MTTVRSRQPASMRTLHQALAAPSRPADEPEGFGEWEGGDMSWAWRQLNRPALPAPAKAPAETKTDAAATKTAAPAGEWPSIQSSIAATAPAAAAPISLVPLRAAFAASASRPAVIRPATARAADPAPIAPNLFEESPPAATDEVEIDGMKWSGAAVAQRRRPLAARRSKVLGISAVAIMVASGVAYSALQILPGPGRSPVVAATAAPFGPSIAPPSAASLIQGPFAPSVAPVTDATTTASIPRSNERLPEPGTPAAFPPVQSVTTTAVVPQPVTVEVIRPTEAVPPADGADPLGDAILIAEKDRAVEGPVTAPSASVTPPTAPTVVAALPSPRTPAPAAPPTAARQPAPSVAAVVPPAAVPSGPRVQATARDYVNLRSGPSNGSSVVTVVAAGSAVDVIRCNYWCQVQVGGSTGWIYQDFLDGPIDRRSRGQAAAPTTTAVAAR